MAFCLVQLSICFKYVLFLRLMSTAFASAEVGKIQDLELGGLHFYFTTPRKLEDANL